MKEETKKRINKLIIPFTTRTISILSAATIVTTGLVGCKEETKKGHTDTTTSQSSSYDDELTSSNSSLVDSSNVSTPESNVSKGGNSSNSNSKDNNSSKTTSDNKKPSSSSKPSNTSSNDGSSSKPTSSTTSKPTQTTMPSTLTESNINDVAVFKHFAEKFRKELGVDLLNFNGHLTDCKQEFQLMLFLLNYEYLDADVIYELFGDCSSSEFKQLWKFTDAILSKLLHDKKTFNYSKYCVNRQLGSGLAKIQNSYVNNKSELKKAFTDYYINRNTSFKYKNTNFWVEYYVYNILSYDIRRDSSYDQDLIDVIFDAYHVLADYDSKCNVVYNNMRNKTKSKY